MEPSTLLKIRLPKLSILHEAVQAECTIDNIDREPIFQKCSRLPVAICFNTWALKTK